MTNISIFFSRNTLRMSYIDVLKYLLWNITKYTLALITFYLAFFYFRYFARYRPLTGPVPLPFVGNLLQYRGHPATWSKRLQEKYGDICEIYMGNEQHIWISRAELVEKIFRPSANNNYLIRITEREGLNEIDVTTKGITFNRDLESWKFNRKFFN